MLTADGSMAYNEYNHRMSDTTHSRPREYMYNEYNHRLSPTTRSRVWTH